MSKVAVVTGGARGIGFSVSKNLAENGFNIVMAGTRPATDRCGELEQLGVKAVYVQANIAEEGGRQNILNTALEHFGRVDVLVNNAGVAPKERRDILEMTEESLDYVLGINLKGTFLMSQLISNQFLKQENEDMPRIINISSVSAYTSSVNRGEYCVSKAAVSMMTTLFADRLAAEGIRVFEIRPGIIKTDMTTGVTEKYNKLIDEGITPIKRWGEPDDIGAVAALLCRKEFDFCTGDVINVDGGFHIRRL